MPEVKMDSISLVILCLVGFTSVATENIHGAMGREGNEGKEIPNDVRIPVADDSRFERIERVESDDADIFWEVTGPPKDFVDGNHPDDGVMTTHDHVDRIVGGEKPPTKRVKKILPPFEGKKKKDDDGDAKSIEEDVKTKVVTAEAEEKRRSAGPAENEKGVIAEAITFKWKEGTTGSRGTETPSTDEPNAKTWSSTETVISSTPVEGGDETQEIRLIPDEKPTEETTGEGREEKKPASGKSIWDLLKEREEFNAEAGSHLNENLPEETNLTSESNWQSDSGEKVEFEMKNPRKGYSNVEKHELPLSYALLWLQVKDQEFDGGKQSEGKEEEKKKKKEKKMGKSPERKPEIPQDVSKMLELTGNENSEVVSDGKTDLEEDEDRPGKWYLLLLTGNSTIVQLRRKDFTKYLKLNLAARLSVEYDDVRVNKVILAAPKILVNVSVFSPSSEPAEQPAVTAETESKKTEDRFHEKGEASLYKLAETNATLLELSGEEYHVIRFLSLDYRKPEAEAHKDAMSITMASRTGDLKFIAYTFLGTTCACVLILAFFLAVNKYFRKVSDLDWPWSKVKPEAWKSDEENVPDKEEFDAGLSPAVIYSGGFPRIRGSWMTGIGHRPEDRMATSVFHQPTGIEMSASPPHRKSVSVRPEPKDFLDPSDSCRHTKLQIYHCDADSLVIPPIQHQSRSTESGTRGKLVRNEGRNDTHPLDVRIQGEKSGQDNPIFTN